MTLRDTRILRPALGALLALACGVTAFLVTSNRHPDVDHPKMQPVWAYTTQDGVVLMHGPERTAEIRRFFDAVPDDMDRVVWTGDATHLAVLDDAVIRQLGENRTALLVVDARTGTHSRIPCPYCDTIAPYGRAGIVASASGGEPDTPPFATFDLTHKRRHGTALQMPPATDRQEYYTLGPATGTANVIWSEDTVHQEPTRTATLLQHHGDTQTDLGQTSDDMPPGPSIAYTEPDSNDITVVTAPEADTTNCRETPGSTRFTATTSGRRVSRALLTTKLPAAAGGRKVGHRFLDMFRTTEHTYATIATWSCPDGPQSTQPARTLHPSALWELKGTQWRPVTNPPLPPHQPLATARLLPDNTWVTLTKADCPPTNQTFTTRPLKCLAGQIRWNQHVITPGATVALALTAPGQ